MGSYIMITVVHNWLWHMEREGRVVSLCIKNSNILALAGNAGVEAAHREPGQPTLYSILSIVQKFINRGR